MNHLGEYHDHIHRYLRFRSRGMFAEAISALDKAIETCPIDEALPVLERMRADTLARVPRKWDFRRLWHNLTFPRDPRTRYREFEVGGPVEES